MWMWVCLVCQAVVATAKSSEREPTYTEYGNSRAVDLYALGTSLAKQLVWPTVQHVNYTLHADTVSSYHLFVTNKTEPCHTHAGSTSSRVISGSGGRCGLLCLLMLPCPHSLTIGSQRSIPGALRLSGAAAPGRRIHHSKTERAFVRASDSWRVRHCDSGVDSSVSRRLHPACTGLHYDSGVISIRVHAATVRCDETRELPC